MSCLIKRACTTDSDSSLIYSSQEVIISTLQNYPGKSNSTHLICGPPNCSGLSRRSKYVLSGCVVSAVNGPVGRIGHLPEQVQVLQHAVPCRGTCHLQAYFGSLGENVGFIIICSGLSGAFHTYMFTK